MPNKNTLDLLEAAYNAVFAAEQAIRKEERELVNIPLYKARIDLAEIIDIYSEGTPICRYVLARDMMK